MSEFNLIMANVPHGKAELVSGAAVAAGSFGGTVVMGRGLTSNALLSAFGFGDTARDLVIILTTGVEYRRIYEGIIQKCREERHDLGLLLGLDADGMMKNGVVKKGAQDIRADAQGEDNMEERSLVAIILNKGYADDAMAAARKAGAGGGTVINARGTAREGDAKFFGMHIVPEKEMLLIVVDSQKKAAVLEAIRTLPCLSEPGSGIAFSAAVNDFMMLGKKN